MRTEGLTTGVPVESPANPFPGLRPFAFGESHLFFGRDGQSDQLIRKLSATRFVAVVGTSGSGKSSLVRAGLLPDLFSGFMPGAGSHWRVALMRPGNDPLGNLARAVCSTEVFGSEIEENARIQEAVTEATLRRGSVGLIEAVRQNRMPSNENLLVVVDQFEEIFRFARVSASEQYRYEAAAFVKLLLEAARQREQNIYVVLTMRSDFLGDCSIFWDLPEAINEGQYLVPRMTRDQRAEAITGPVAVCGGRIEQRLVNRLLNDTGDNPDLLPILQHALMRTWENWVIDHSPGESLDLRHYEAVGTMSDALSLHADEAYNELADERSRLIAEKVFKALTEKGEDNREVRRPMVLGDLLAVTGATLAEVVSVLEHFRREGRSFLMPPASATPGEDTLIDISHESLIRNWARLKEWVGEESQSAQIYTRLADTAVLHENKRARLWGDPDLQLALDWRERTNPTVAWAERYHPAFDSAMKFLDASVEARDAEERAAERRRRRGIWVAVIVALVFFLLFMLSLGAFVYANVQKTRAEDALARAEAATIDAQSSRVRADVGRVMADIERSRADERAEDARRKEEIANEATKDALEKKKEADEAKAAAVESAESARRNELRAKEATSRAEAEVENNKRLLYASTMNLAQQAYAANDISGGRPTLDAYAPGAGRPRDFGWYYLWRLFNSESETFDVGKGTTFALTPDGRTLLAVKYERGVLLDAASRRELKSFDAADMGGIRQLAVSPDGRYLAATSYSDSIRLLDTASGSLVLTLQADDSRNISYTRGDRSYVHATAMAFSPDGSTLALCPPPHSAVEGGGVELWDVASGKKKKSLPYEHDVRSIAFSPDGRSVVALAVDETVPVWDVASGEMSRLANEGTGELNAVAFSPDGKLIAAVGSPALVKLWDATTRKLSGSAENRKKITISGRGQEDAFDVMAFSPDGKLLAAGAVGSSIKIFDVPTLRERATLQGHESGVDFVGFLPDGATLMSYDDDGGAFKLWDVASLIRERDPLSMDGSGGLDFSRDGRTLFAGSRGKPVAWDVGTRRPLDVPQLVRDDYARGLALSRDGTRLAFAVFKPVTHNGEQSVVYSIMVWDTAGYKQVAEIDLPQDTTLHSFGISPDGRRVVVGHSDSTLDLWDVETRKLLKTARLGGGPLPFNTTWSVAFSPDGERIAVGFSGDAVSVKVWDKNLTREVAALGVEGDRGTAFEVDFSPDGRFLAGCFYKGYVKIWDAHSLREVATLRGHKGSVHSVAFSPDGRTIATGGGDATVKLWDTSSFKELLTLSGHEGEVDDLAFSPDSKTLASSSFGGMVRLWRAATDEEVKRRRRVVWNPVPQ